MAQGTGVELLEVGLVSGSIHDFSKCIRCLIEPVSCREGLTDGEPGFRIQGERAVVFLFSNRNLSEGRSIIYPGGRWGAILLCLMQKCTSFCGEGQSLDFGIHSWKVKPHEFAARRYMPQANSPIVSTRCECFPVGAETNTRDVSCMSDECSQFATRSNIAEPNQGTPAGVSYGAAIGREGSVETLQPAESSYDQKAIARRL